MYPAVGEPLLPQALVPWLGTVRVRPQVVRAAGLSLTTTLADLDAGVWQRHSRATVDALGREVAHAVVHAMHGQIGDVRVFEDRPVLGEVSARTRNLLGYHNLIDSGCLKPTTLGSLWNLPNLGALTLLEILTATELRAQREPRPTNSAKWPSRAVRKAAVRLAGKRWAGRVSRDDPRVGDDVALLHPLAGTAKEAAELMATEEYSPSEAKRTASAIRDFISSMETLRKMPLESEMSEVVGALVGEGAARVALTTRTGLDGSEPSTLEQAGRTIGVTRERVRQLEKKLKKQLADSVPPWTPALDRALAVASAQLPASEAILEQALVDAGLTEGGFSTASLLSAAAVFSKDCPFSVMDGHVVPRGNWPSQATVRTAARRLVEHWGLTTLDEVEAVLRDGCHDVDPQLLRLLLEDLENLHWLDPEKRWFWLSGGRNRLLNQVTKIMSVAGSIDLAELRTGVGRHHRMAGFRPPKETLAALCIATGKYRRTGNRISGNTDLPDWRDVLGRNERVLAGVLFDFGPVMRRDDLERIAVKERGLNRNSFYVYLTYSPIIARYAAGVFGLRGAAVTAAEVEALVPPRARNRVLLDHGWTENGQLWAAFRISPSSEVTGILGTPAAFRPIVEGSYALYSESEHQVGTLVVEQNMWGLTPFFRRWGVEAGDYVVIAIDIEDRTATISTGDEELLWRYQRRD